MTLKKMERKIAHSGLKVVLQRFPEQDPVFHRLFLKSSSFRSLCEDYRDCLAELKHWQASIAAEAPDWRQTYAHLLEELEQELWQYLRDEAVSHSASGKD
jgi:hypothetical protein